MGARRERLGSWMRLVLLCLLAFTLRAQALTPVLVLTEEGGTHGPYVEAARAYLKTLSQEQRLELTYLDRTESITRDSLSRYRLIIQLNFPPYTWTPKAMEAFVDYIEKGRGGWVGFHHATLLGEFDGYPMWPWFSAFMGGIRFKSYIPTFAAGQVRVEDSSHPCMKGLPGSFTIAREEWYIYDHSPRPNVHVLASVDESTYAPRTETKMGDHPVIWTNDRMAARNVYIFMGHGADLFENPAYRTLVRNAVLWAAGK